MVGVGAGKVWSAEDETALAGVGAACPGGAGVGAAGSGACGQGGVLAWPLGGLFLFFLVTKV